MMFQFAVKAEMVYTSQRYFHNKIKEISDILKANKILDLVSKSLTVKSNESKRIDFQPIDITVRRSNYISIQLLSSLNHLY